MTELSLWDTLNHVFNLNMADVIVDRYHVFNGRPARSFMVKNQPTPSSCSPTPFPLLTNNPKHKNSNSSICVMNYNCSYAVGRILSLKEKKIFKKKSQTIRSTAHLNRH